MDDWNTYELGELLLYEQPSKYIVKSTVYDNSYVTPVLTAGKSFVLGYTNEEDGIYPQEGLPVIIFDDFTTSSKYVDFAFKVKSSAMKILKPNTALVLPKYIFYRMQIIQFDHSTHKRYWIQQYSKLKVAIPELSEQQRIVEQIEGILSKLDAGVETLQKVRQQVDVYRLAVLQNEFDGYKSWKKCQLSDLFEGMRNGYGKKPLDSGNYKILKISAVRAMTINFDEKRKNDVPFNEEDLIRENDILFTRYNGSKDYVGVCARVPKLTEDFAYPDKIIRCRLKNNSAVHSKFLQYWLNQGEARKYIRSKIKTTSGQNGISGGDLKQTPVFLPSLDVQEQIVIKIEEKMSVCNRMEKTIDLLLLQAENLRQSILKSTFEGSIQS